MGGIEHKTAAGGKGSKRFRRSLEAAGFRAATGLALVLPWVVLRALASLLGTLYYYFHPSGRRVARANLALAFPELPAGERERIARRSFLSAARNGLEMLASARLKDEPFERHFTFAEGSEELYREARSRGRGTVVATFHVGNWEWFSLGSAIQGLLADIAAQRIKNPKVDSWIRATRESLGHRVLLTQDGVRPMIRSLREHRMLGLLVDLNMPRSKGGEFVNFFGKPVLSTIAAPALARQTGSDLLIGYSIRREDGRYEIHIEELRGPFASDRDAAEAILAVAERVVRAHPEQWIWMYKRWKFRPRGSRPEDFPFYAYEVD